MTGIKLKQLKAFADRKLADYPITRDFILNESDVISPEDFILKSKLWLQLLEKEVQMKKSG